MLRLIVSGFAIVFGGTLGYEAAKDTHFFFKRLVSNIPNIDDTAKEDKA